MLKSSLENGTHATLGGRSGPALRGPSPFLGVTFWSLLGGVGNAWRDEDLRWRAGGCPAVRGGRPGAGGWLLPPRGRRRRPPVQRHRGAGERAGAADR